MSYPNFIGIGAMRSGTTWLHYNLREHPEIWMPPLKELHYFDDKEKFATLSGKELLDYKLLRYKKRLWLVSKSIKMQKRSQLFDPGLQTISWYYKYLFAPFRNDRWYSELFETGRGQQIGEITPEYSLLNLESVKQIRQLMPEAKIVFLMRNPIDRAWSHFLKTIRDKNRPLNSVLETEFIQHFNSDKSRKKSDYKTILETWQLCYPKEQIFTAFFEEVTNSPEDLLKKIFEFLEVEPSLKYVSKTKSNKFNSTKNEGIPQNLARYLAKIYYQEIKELEQFIGGYSSNWLKYAEEILDAKDADLAETQITL